MLKKLIILLALVVLSRGISSTAVVSNVHATEGTILFSEDWESGLDTSKWQLYGSPLPSLYPGQGVDGSTAINNNGDANWNSGLFLKVPFDVTNGISLEYMQRGEGPIGHYWTGNDVGFTLCSPTVDHASQCPGNTWLSWIWTYPEANITRYYAVYASDWLDEPWLPLRDEWHKFAFTIHPDGIVTFYRDDVLMYTSSTPIDLEAADHAWLQISGRSWNSHFYTDNLIVRSVPSSNSPPEIDAGGPYYGDEGAAIVLSGTASDSDGDQLTVQWSSNSPLCTIADPGFLETTMTCTDNVDTSVTLTVNDGVNEDAVDSADVFVDNLAPIITKVTARSEPVAIFDQPVAVSVEYADPGSADTHTVTWDWGDNSAIDEQSNALSPAMQAHIYSQPGVYTLLVKVIDDDGGVAEKKVEYIVIYDPEGGFVTGGGWIDSPAEAYVLDPSLTGKATFGFVSKYKKGANVPTGQTEFQFNVADLNFHSDTYDWLVVAGHRAQFKGTGTINGTGNYGFMLTTTDEALTPSTDVDLFRIKIWDKDNGDTLVYDNQIECSDDADDADPCTGIEGGNIVIHQGK